MNSARELALKLAVERASKSSPEFGILESAESYYAFLTKGVEPPQATEQSTPTDSTDIPAALLGIVDEIIAIASSKKDAAVSGFKLIKTVSNGFGL